MCADLIGLLDTLEIPSASVVGHDLGGLVAYAMGRLHPERVSHLAPLDAPLPLLGLEVPAWSQIEKRLWHQRFHRVPFLKEALIGGRERLYLSWHYAQTIQNVGAISAEDIDEYVRCYTQAGGLAASFAFGRAIDMSAEQVRAASQEKMAISLLFFGGAAIPAVNRRSDFQHLRAFSLAGTNGFAGRTLNGFLQQEKLLQHCCRLNRAFALWLQKLRFPVDRFCEIQSTVYGGRGGIRTHGTLAGTPVFKTGSLNHSDTLPSH